MKNSAKLLLLSVLISCKKRDSAVVAGNSFCECLRVHVNDGRYAALRFCHEKLDRVYSLLRIYGETRDTSLSDVYNEEVNKQVHEFVAEFASTVDDCNPPFWFKDPNESIKDP